MNMSAQAQAYDHYKKASVETVSSEKLLIMLFDGAIRFLGNAEIAIDEKNIEHAHNQIVKTEDIIVELMSTLDMQYEISSSLYTLYEYMYRRLIEANIGKDRAIVGEVKSFLAQMRDTWAEAIEIIKTENKVSAPEAPVNPVPVAVPSKTIAYNAVGGAVKPAAGLNIKG